MNSITISFEVCGLSLIVLRLLDIGVFRFKYLFLKKDTNMKDKLHHIFFCTLSVLCTAYRLRGHPLQERTRMHDVENVLCMSTVAEH